MQNHHNINVLQKNIPYIQGIQQILNFSLAEQQPGDPPPTYENGGVFNQAMGQCDCPSGFVGPLCQTGTLFVISAV